MCDLIITESLAAQVPTDGFVERRMESFAHDAKVDKRGILDATNTHLRTGFAADLRKAGVRKKQVGRHRVYFTGEYTDCTYTAFFIKENKRGDDWSQDDNNPDFQSLVRTALSAESLSPRILFDPDGPRPAESVPDYQNADWFKEQRKYLGAAPDEEEQG